MTRLAMLPTIAFVLSTSLAAGHTPPPTSPQKPKFIPPVRGIATIEVILGVPRRVGRDVVSKIKVRNTSKGSINLLKVDEYWYDAQSKIVSAAQYAHTKAPIQPGEIVEIEIRAPYESTMRQNQRVFAHANGKVDAKAVKVFK